MKPRRKAQGDSAALNAKLTRASFVAWSTKGLYAVSDQGLFALSNFIMNILLARWLSPAEYGAFSLVFALFILLGTLHTGLLTDPMLVFGSGRHRGALTDYLTVVLKGHWYYSLAVSSVLLILTFVLWGRGDTLLTSSMLGLVLATPFVLLQWLTRRASYAVLRPQLAAAAGAIYMALILGLLYMLYSTGRLSTLAALIIMGFASFISASWLLRRLQVPLVFSAPGSVHQRQIMTDHWHYGKWAASTHLLHFLPYEVYYVFLAFWGGLEATATMKANMNLVLPILHGASALGVLLVPTLVRVIGSPNFYRIVRWGSIAFVLMAVLYGFVLGGFHDVLLTLLYGSGRYTGHAWLGWSLALIALTNGPQPVLGAALNALERPDLTFWSYVVATGVTFTAGIALMATFGVIGALAGLAASNATAAIMNAWLLKRLPRSPTDEVAR